MMHQLDRQGIGQSHPVHPGRLPLERELAGWNLLDLPLTEVPARFDTLAATESETGNFDDAVKWQNEYLESDYLKFNPSNDTPEKAANSSVATNRRSRTMKRSREVSMGLVFDRGCKRKDIPLAV